MPERTELPEEERAALPLVVQGYIRALETQVEALQDHVATLQAQVSALQAQVRQHSGNSSRPPSSDPPSAPVRRAQQPSGRRRGGQPGHPGHTRTLLAVEEVDTVVDHYPPQCPGCATLLAADLPDAGEVLRQQVWEIPPVQPQVTEHRYHRVCCPQCQHVVRAARPAAVPPGAFGPRLTAVASLLHGRYRLSAREVQNLLAEVCGVPLSLGSVPPLWQEVSAALATPTAEAQAAVERSAVANVDETGWKQAGQRRWLWVAVSAVCSVFLVAPHRSAAVLRQVVGSDFRGIVGSDRFTAYLSVPVERRQLCWAHLKRNLVAFQERDGPVGAWGSQAVDLVAQVFTAWAQFQAGTLDRPGLQAALAPLQEAWRTLLTDGQDLALDHVQAFCREVLALWPALWTFSTTEGVAPTNNVAAQALRPAVLWRKGCFGADSAAGNLFVARILTVTATCHQQQRHLLSFLADALAAHWAGLPAPSLLAP